MKKIYILALLLTSQLYSQKVIGPGGVSGTVLWMKTIPDNTDFYGNYKWKDHSGDLLRLNFHEDTGGGIYGQEYMMGAEFSSRNYSFSSALRLISPDHFSKEIRIKSSNLSTATIIGIFGENNYSGDRFNQPDYLFTLNGLPGKGVVVSKDKIINSNESKRGILDYGSETGYDLMFHQGKSPEPTINKYKEQALRSFVYYKTNKPNKSVWGEKQKSNLSLGSKYYGVANKNNNSTYDVSSFDSNKYFDGFIPEIFIYDRLLTPLERIKTESYLAVKYGFPIEQSYISSEDQLIWDREYGNKKYNSRITGIYRDDKSGLYQKEGTTGYEEAPYFPYTKEGDSFEGRGNRYGLSNRSKLLVIERFPANDMKDMEYTIWGDNNEGIQTQEEEEFLGLKVMKRRWLVNTNMGGKKPVPKTLKWNIKDLDTTEDGYKITFRKTPSSTAQFGSMFTELPLKNYEGHISFTIENLTGYIAIKFGTKNPIATEGTHDYGLYINPSGDVFPIIRGKIRLDKKWALKLAKGDRVRINKTKDYFIISRNGDASRQNGYALSQIYLEKEDIEKPFYITARVEKGNQDVIIKDVRHGGIIDTGNRVELSYIANRATEFANYTQGKAYMLVDRTGTGEFKKGTTDMYVSDEYDPYREKITFNNVFFDTDFNTKDVFTFGYRQNNLVANIEKKNPACKGNTPLADGKINIEIKRGDEGFEYQLLKKETSQIVKKGTFFGNNLALDGLSVGNYIIKLKEIGGFNALSDSTGVKALANSHGYITRATVGYLFENTIKTIKGNYQMGLTPWVETIAQVNMYYGFEIDKDRIYIVNQSIKSPVAVNNITLKVGDKVDIYNDKPGQVQFRVNGVVFHTQTLSTGTSKFGDIYHFINMLNNNVGGAYHIKNTATTYLDWNYQGVKLVPLSEDSIEHNISLESTCLTIINKQENQIAETEGSNLVMYYKDFSNQSEITSKLKLVEASPVMFIVFDFSGNMVYKKNISESSKEHIIDLKGLPKGVYIVKAFTSKEEFTKKITIN